MNIVKTYHTPCGVGCICDDWFATKTPEEIQAVKDVARAEAQRIWRKQEVNEKEKGTA